MNVASEPAHSSLAQRIAKVRNCMLVEVATGVSVTNKTLFVSLCQKYEQQSILTSYLPDESPQSSSNQALLSHSYLAEESIPPHDSATIPGKDIAPTQHRFGFSIINCVDMIDFDDWSDWDNTL